MHCVAFGEYESYNYTHIEGLFIYLSGRVNTHWD